MVADRFDNAIAAFDLYNTKDPNREGFKGEEFPKEVLYAQRMTERLNSFAPNASESIRLAARCQHIGRWEIPRSNYPMDKKGYFQWRNEEKLHHAKLAEEILSQCQYDIGTIGQVKNLVLKKELRSNPETQLLEDVVCLVFIEYYLDEFASKHDGEKVIDIIRKTVAKMSREAVEVASQIALPNKIHSLMREALNPNLMFRFEEEFMEGEIRCVPMVVRLKLDGCGIKLKLSEWNELSLEERSRLLQFPVRGGEDLTNFRNLVRQLVMGHTGKAITDMTVEENSPWLATAPIPASLQEKSKEFGWSISLCNWQSLSNLQRFVLLKLSRPHHANKNFPKAMREFGL
jgi:hypothetical protein